MKAFLLSILLFAFIGGQIKFFKYKDTSLKFKGKDIKVSGSLIFTNEGNDYSLTYLAMDKGTMTPYMVMAAGKGYMSGDTLSISLACVAGKWGNGDTDMLQGVLKAEGSWDSIEVKGTCTGIMGSEWVIQCKAQGSNNMHYEYKEAGQRAVDLVDQPNTLYVGPVIITYSIMDATYTDLTCETILKTFPKTSDAKPGYIIVGKLGLHCGILDGEGDKFVHDDVSKRKVVHTPLALANQFFPEGHEFRTYPPI